MEHDHIIVFSGNTHCDKIGEKSAIYKCKIDYTIVSKFEKKTY